MFLREVATFRGSMYAVEVDQDAQFREFLRIVDQFVKSGSSYEVNIDSRARTEVMRYCEESRFKELDAVSHGFQQTLCALEPPTAKTRHGLDWDFYYRSQQKHCLRSQAGKGELACHRVGEVSYEEGRSSANEAQRVSCWSGLKVSADVKTR